VKRLSEEDTRGRWSWSFRSENLRRRSGKIVGMSDRQNRTNLGKQWVQKSPRIWSDKGRRFLIERVEAKGWSGDRHSTSRIFWAFSSRHSCVRIFLEYAFVSQPWHGIRYEHNNEEDNHSVLRPAHKSDLPSRVYLVDSFDHGIELIERGALIDHFSPQKYSIVSLTYENQFT
jgi:hypothetical protein